MVARDAEGNVKRDAFGQPLPGRVKLCRRAVQDLAGGVALKVTSTADGLVGGLSGVQTCGSVWVCPVCSEKINASRQGELEAGLHAWMGGGKGVLMLTLTVQHNRGHGLEALWDAISPAWNRLTSGSSAWNGGKVRKNGSRSIGDKERFGIAGYVRLVETKHGAHGWHPHIHALLFTNDTLSPVEVSDLRARLAGRWEAAIVREGYRVRTDAVGADLRSVTSSNGIADYFAKNTYGLTASGAAFEVTGSQSKRLGKGGVTPFQLLERLVANGDEADLHLWHEWERVSHGRRQLTWSRGMRDLLGLEVELTDAEIAEDDAMKGETVVTLTREEWGYVRHDVPSILDALEDGTIRGFLSNLLLPDDRWADAGRSLAPHRRRKGPGSPVTAQGRSAKARADRVLADQLALLNRQG